MRNIKKVKFSDIIGMLESDEMREITGGYGETYACGSYSPSGGSSGSYNPDSILAGFGGGTAIGSTFGGIPYNPNSSPSSNNGIATGGSTNGNYGTSSYTAGWNYSNGIMRTNDPNSIDRYLTFFYKNNGALSSSQLNNFIENESTTAGQLQNNLQLYGTVLNNVTVTNNYKGPSTIAAGLSYNNGILEYNNYNYIGSNSSSSVASSTNTIKTPPVLTAFTKDQIVTGFNKISFSEMALRSISYKDPLTGKYDYSKMFQPVMKVNVDGAATIALYEKLSLKVYDLDSNTSQNTTIGFGHKLHAGAIKAGDLQSINFDQAVAFFAQDIINAENSLNQKLENMGLTGVFNRSQYFALFDMAYNGGISDDSVLTNVLNNMKGGGINAANRAIENAYLTANPNNGIMDRRYFEAQAFICGRSITPEEAKAELVKLGLKK